MPPLVVVPPDEAVPPVPVPPLADPPVAVPEDGVELPPAVTVVVLLPPPTVNVALAPDPVRVAPTLSLVPSKTTLPR